MNKQQTYLPYKNGPKPLDQIRKKNSPNMPYSVLQFYYVIWKEKCRFSHFSNLKTPKFEQKGKKFFKKPRNTYQQTDTLTYNHTKQKIFLSDYSCWKQFEKQPYFSFKFEISTCKRSIATIFVLRYEKKFNLISVDNFIKFSLLCINNMMFLI